MRRPQGQMSVEYLLLIAFALAVLLPTIYYFYTQGQSEAMSLSGAQYARLGQEMLATAKRVHAQGTGSWLTLDAQLPENVLAFNITGGGSEMAIRYQTPVGPTEAVFFSDELLLANATGEDGSVFRGEPHQGPVSFRLALDRDGKVRIGEEG